MDLLCQGGAFPAQRSGLRRRSSKATTQFHAQNSHAPGETKMDNKVILLVVTTAGDDALALAAFRKGKDAVNYVHQHRRLGTRVDIKA